MQQPPNPYPQFQQLSQQQSQQQPNYTQPKTYNPPQPPQQPPSTSKTLDRTLWILLGVAIGLVFGLIFGTAYEKQQITTTTVQDTMQAISQSQPTQAATQAAATPSHFTVGMHVTSGIWLITINSAKTNTGNEFDTPKAGNIYLLINFTAKNNDTSNHDMSPNYFTLRDNQGNTYDLAYITVPSDPRGAVVAGQQLRGDLSYEISKSLHSFILQFDPPDDIDNNQIVQWTIQI